MRGPSSTISKGIAPVNCRSKSVSATCAGWSSWTSSSAREKGSSWLAKTRLITKMATEHAEINPGRAHEHADRWERPRAEPQALVRMAHLGLRRRDQQKRRPRSR